ncbi:MAG: long-chain fatty acid--CoA ligase [Gammaproteobacteria bacterium]|jgi:long-chain acyl-CoA synthetase
MTGETLDTIIPANAVSLAGLFRERVRHSPASPAYYYFDNTDQVWRFSTWTEVARMAGRWQAGFIRDGLQRGDRIAIMARNCREWVCCDQAALGLGLVVVPLYANDRAENAAYILRDAGVKWLLIEGKEHWRALSEVRDELSEVARIVSIEGITAGDDRRLRALEDWLPSTSHEFRDGNAEPQDLATIVYTSGTTGHPKGVMLSHRNILWNAYAGLNSIPIFKEDMFLSFLPLSHTLERTVGYYLPMMAGAAVAHARSIPLLAEDMAAIRPTLIVSVPRIFERIHARIHAQLEGKALARRLFGWAAAVGWQRFQCQQGRTAASMSALLWPLLDGLVAAKIRAKLGGRLRAAICGGAALPKDVAQVFIGLGVPLLQGYGLTETSPVISVNLPNDNDPFSVGVPLRDVELRIGSDDELLVRSPGVCMGYWRQAEASAALIDREGWLHSGDKARIENNHIYITGRLKEIIVLANGEKVPPVDMEAAISRDPLFEQVLVIGEGRPYLSALLVLDNARWQAAARDLGVDPQAEQSLHDPQVESWIVQHVARQCSGFPGYAKVRRAALSLTPWTVENGFSTPTLKLRRGRIIANFQDEIARLYEGH